MSFRAARFIPIVSLAIFLPLLFVVNNAAKAATTIVVNSTADTTANDGECTLREAITAANSDVASGAAVGECAAGSGTDTIHFALTGGSDYTLGSAAGYKIELQSSLPSITAPVTINGYSQTGAAVNTAVSPAPMNGKLLIDIDGSALDDASTVAEHCLTVDGVDGAIIRGLIIENCGGDGVRVLNSSNTSLVGNYLGVTYNDTTDVANVSRPNGRTYPSNPSGNGVFIYYSDHTTIGGTAAADRNVIAGNQFSEILIDSDYAGSDPDDPAESSYTVVQGNYIGVAADGVTILPCGYEVGHGNALLITHSSNDLIGGTAAGASNVIAASKEYGISFRNGSSNSVVEGNIMGADYTGNNPALHSLGAGHVAAAVSIATVSNGGYNLASHDIRVGSANAAGRNYIGANQYTGPSIGYEMGFGVYAHDGAYAIDIIGNQIGLGMDGTTALMSDGPGIAVTESSDAIVQSNVVTNNRIGVYTDSGSSQVTITQNTIRDNEEQGISIQRTSDVVIGGVGQGNSIYANGLANIQLQGFSLAANIVDNVVIQGNSIGTLNNDVSSSTPRGGAGILLGYDPTNVLIGGTGEGEGNLVFASQGVGIGFMSLYVDLYGLGLGENSVSILGNSIYATSPSHPTLTSYNSGVGIDLFRAIDESEVPDGVADSYAGIGTNTNNGTGSVPGDANDYLNHPELTSAAIDGNQITINYDLVVDGSGVDAYRVEFYGNSVTTEGQGKTYIGSEMMTAGTGKNSTFTLPSGYSASDKYITATVTRMDDGGNAGTFGATSEFSPLVTATVTNVDEGSNGGGTNGGNNTTLPAVLPKVGAGIGTMILLVAGVLATVTYLRRRQVLKKP